MTALSDQIVRQLLLRGRQSADTIGEALAFSTPVIERQLERMVTDGSVQASVDAADGPVMFTLTEEERRRCRGKYRQRTAGVDPMSDMDHTPIESYATRGLRLWAAPLNPHGRHCRCLSCADARAYMKYPAMTPPMVTALQREERAS